MTTTTTDRLPARPAQQQLNLLDQPDAELALDEQAAASSDALAWQLGRDHARHGLALPVGHLHAGSPLYAGWQAAIGPGSARHRDPAPGVRAWLQLRLAAWQQGLTYDEQLLTAHYLQQLDRRHCPVTRAELHDEIGHPAERCYVRLRPQEGYRAGQLAVVSRMAAQAINGRSLEQLRERALLATQRGDTLEGLTPACWQRLVALLRYANPQALETQALPLLPPNRLRLSHPLHALQAWIGRQLASPGWSQRLLALHDQLSGIPARQGMTALTAALAPLALRLPTAGPALAWALDDVWLDARVQRRWAQLATQVSPLTLERLLRQLPAPQGFVVEQHQALAA